MRPREDNKNRTKIINPDEEEINARPPTTTSSVHLYDHMRSATGSSCMQIPSLVQLFVGCINRSHEYIKSFTFNQNARQSSSPLPFIEPSSNGHQASSSSLSTFRDCNNDLARTDQIPSFLIRRIRRRQKVLKPLWQKLSGLKGECGLLSVATVGFIYMYTYTVHDALVKSNSGWQWQSAKIST